MFTIYYKHGIWLVLLRRFSLKNGHNQRNRPEEGIQLSFWWHRKGHGQTFQNEGAARVVQGDWLGQEMADLHRPMYKVSFHGGLKGGWASDGGGVSSNPALSSYASMWREALESMVLWNWKNTEMPGLREPIFSSVQRNNMTIPSHLCLHFSLSSAIPKLAVLYSSGNSLPPSLLSCSSALTFLLLAATSILVAGLSHSRFTVWQEKLVTVTCII